jgi:hypothetical protein
MSDKPSHFESYLPPDFDEQLDKLISSQGTDAEIGKELQASIMEVCRKVNAELAKSFDDLSSTGFEIDNEQGEKDQ